MDGVKVEVLFEAHALCGEGPHWIQHTNTLLWVDIPARTLNFLDIATRTNKRCCRMQ